MPISPAAIPTSIRGVFYSFSHCLKDRLSSFLRSYISSFLRSYMSRCLRSRVSSCLSRKMDRLQI